MRRVFVGILTAVALLGAGWSAGRAQTSQPDFVLRVDGPAGPTTVTCVRGCELVFACSADNPRAGHMTTFSYGCNSTDGRCSSREIAGWVRR